MNSRITRVAGLLGLAVAACSSAPQPIENAQPAPPVAMKTGPAISEADLKERLYLIADDSMGGRPTGSVGHIKATHYIANEMKRLGLQPGGDKGTYFQAVPFVRRKISTTNLTVDGQALTLWDDFVPIHPCGTVRSLDNVQVVYGGIVQDTNTFISSEKAAGKLVLLFNRTGGPSSRSTVRSRLETAAAVATVQTPQGMNLFRNFLRNPGPSYTGGTPPTGERGMAIVVTQDVAAKLMGVPLDTTIAVGTAGKTVRGAVNFVEEPVTANNVIGILPGSDPKLKGQYVAMGAHSDHVPPRIPPVDHDSLRAVNLIARKMQLDQGGRRLTQAERAAIKVNVDSLRKIRPARYDSINNGADDDGSGTVALIEIAEAMAAAKQKPARSVVFIWHVAEELGLIGATYFTDNPTIPRDSIVANLNMDMIGRGGPGEEAAGGPDYIQLIGWRRLSNELGDIVDAANKAQKQPFKFDLTYDAAGHPEQYYCRSDHERYARYSIPIAFFSTGNHADYHQITDEPQYIDYTKLRNVAQLIHDVGMRVANLDHRPVVDGPRPDPKGQCRQ